MIQLNVNNRIMNTSNIRNNFLDGDIFFRFNISFSPLPNFIAGIFIRHLIAKQYQHTGYHRFQQSDRSR